MNMSLTWMPDEDATLKTYAEQGRSASEVMQALRGRSRSAILGRADRLRIKFHGYGASNRQKLPSRIKKPKPEKRISIFKPDPQIPEIDDSHLPSISLAVASPQHCRWVIGSPKFYRTCANTAARDCPYCVYHARIAFANIKPVQTFSAGVPK